MLIYLILFFISLGGIGIIILKHKKEFVVAVDHYEQTQNNANFAAFMEKLQARIVSLWYLYLHSAFCLFIEKRLRWVRILVLKIEHFLFRALHRVRGIAEYGNGNGGNSNNGSGTTNNNETNKN